MGEFLAVAMAGTDSALQAVLATCRSELSELYATVEQERRRKLQRWYVFCHAGLVPCLLLLHYPVLPCIVHSSRCCAHNVRVEQGMFTAGLLLVQNRVCRERCCLPACCCLLSDGSFRQDEEPMLE